ncbi:MAG: hypothetical protein ABIP35_01460 [Ginsengibacter sp.]
MEWPMKNKCLVTFLLFSFLLMFSLNSFSQEEIIDSASETVSATADTVVKRSAFIDQNDSLVKMKNDRSFTYITYLDSLLRKQKMRADSTTNTGPPSTKKSNYSYLNNILNSGPLKIFFWLLAGIFILYMGYKIFINRDFFKRGKSNILDENVEDLSLTLEDYNQYEKWIHDAESRSEWNKATRYLYLQTIKNLSDKGSIIFSHEKTNQDYLDEFSENKHHEDFAFLTRNYDYVWYGKFPIGKEKYDRLKELFLSFNKKL